MRAGRHRDVVVHEYNISLLHQYILLLACHCRGEAAVHDETICKNHQRLPLLAYCRYGEVAHDNTNVYRHLQRQQLVDRSLCEDDHAYTISDNMGQYTLAGHYRGVSYYPRTSKAPYHCALSSLDYHLEKCVSGHLAVARLGHLATRCTFPCMVSVLGGFERQ
jgi:hypothetical protein